LLHVIILMKLVDTFYKWSLWFIFFDEKHNIIFYSELFCGRILNDTLYRTGQRSSLRQRRVWTANILGDNIIFECICGVPVNETENGWVHPRHVNANDDNGASRKHNQLRNRKSAFCCIGRWVNYAFNYVARVIYCGPRSATWTESHRKNLLVKGKHKSSINIRKLSR